MNLFFLDSEKNMGGVERWMINTAGKLRERGHRSYFSGRKGSIFLNRSIEEGFEAFPLKIQSDFGIINIYKLASLFNQLHIDVIITNLNKDTRLAGVARLFVNKIALVSRHGLPILPNNWIYRLTFRHFADGIITPCNHIKKTYLTYGWCQANSIRIIHNGIDSDVPIDFVRDEVLKQFHIPDRRPILGIFGRLVPQKRHTLFLDIAKNVLQQWPQAVFLIVGDGPLRQDIRQYATDLNISENVLMLGHQKDVMELYSICDLVLQTSQHEGLPNVVLEAMFAAKPVITFDVGGVKEMIPSQEVGVVLPSHDIFSMTQSTLDILRAPERRKAIGHAARQHILDNFSLTGMIDQVENYLREVMARKRGQRMGPPPLSR